MTGLEKILDEIEQAAKQEADQALAAAKIRAQEMAAAERLDSEKRIAAIQAESAASVQDILRAGDSAVGLQRRQQILAAKQKLLADTLKKALAAVQALPDGEYFALLCRLAAQNAEKGEGLLLLGQKDKARLPAGFEAQLAAALPAGASLKLASETRPIEGGCILKYGDIEQNCTFAAVIEARREEFSDAVRDILFAS